MDHLWEFVKGFGALVGLISGAWLLFERFVKERPFVAIVPRKHFAEAVEWHAMLRVENQSKRPILVSWKNRPGPGRMGIARDNSVRGIIAALVEGESTIAIDGGEARELLLLNSEDYDEADDDNHIEIELHWSFAQAAIWQRDRRLVRRIRKRSLLDLLSQRKQLQD